MPLNPSAIVEGATAGLVGSVLLAVFSLTRGRVGNLFLKRRVERSFKSLSYGGGVDGITIGIPNKIGRPIVVHQVKIKTGPVGLTLNPTAVVRTLCPAIKKLSREERRKLKTGELQVIPGEAELGLTPHRDKAPSGFVKIEPHTSREFILGADMVPAIKTTILSVDVIVEYIDNLKEVRLIRVSVNDGVEILNYFASEMASEIESGAFDRHRALLKMPPIGSIRR